MHDQPNAGPQAPAPGSRAYEVQRIVLFELVLAPPRRTDDVAELAARSGEPAR